MREDPLYRPLPDSFDPPAPATPPPLRRPGFSWCLALLAFLWLGSFTAALWFIVPKFAEVYRQVKVPMGDLTRHALDASRAACRYPCAFLLGVLLASAWAGTWKGRWKTAAKLLLPTALTITVGAIVVALFMPLIGSLEGVRPLPGRSPCGVRCDR